MLSQHTKFINFLNIQITYRLNMYFKKYSDNLENIQISGRWGNSAIGAKRFLLFSQN